MTDQKRLSSLRRLLALLAGTLLLSSILLVQQHGHGRSLSQSSRTRLRSNVIERRLSWWGNNDDTTNGDDGGAGDDAGDDDGDDVYYSYGTDDGNTDDGKSDDGWWSSGSSNGSSNGNSNGNQKYDNGYLWARDDDDDYYTDDDKGNYWEANKNYKSSNYVSWSGGGGSSVQNNNANYGSQTFDGSGEQANYGYYQTEEEDDDGGGTMEFGLLTSEQRIGLAITASILMILLLFCFLFGPHLIHQYCWMFRGLPRPTTQTDMYATFSNLGDF